MGSRFFLFEPGTLVRFNRTRQGHPDFVKLLGIVIADDKDESTHYHVTVLWSSGKFGLYWRHCLDVVS